MMHGRVRQLTALVIALGLLGCAPAPPQPSNGLSAPAHRVWLPETEPKAVILALHGFNDYSNAFAELGDFAARRAVAVHAYDQSGFGANPDAGLWPGVATLVGDLRREIERLSDLYPEAPIYLLGESMGAAVVIAAAGDQPLGVAGTILSAPAVWGGDQLNPFYRATLWVAAQVVPGLTLTGEGLDVLASDNIEMLRALGADPLVIKGTRVDAIAGLVALMDRALARAGDLPGPVLVLRGARDEIVPPSAQARMLNLLTAEPCTEVIYSDGWHLLLRDLQRELVWTDVVSWVLGEAVPSRLDAPCGGSLTSVAASLE